MPVSYIEIPWKGGPGWAPIKPEYLRSRVVTSLIDQTSTNIGLSSSSSSDTRAEPNVTTSSSSTSSSSSLTTTQSSDKGAGAVTTTNTNTNIGKDDSSKKRSRKEHRGQNKNRSSDDIGFNAGGGNQLCRWVMLGQAEKCRFGAAKCRDRHDMAKFLASKDEDLGPRCYVFDTYGVCPAGLNCRFGKGHIDPVTKEVVVSELPPERRPALQQSSTTVNSLPYFLGGQLQRGRYDFLYAPPLNSSKHRQQQQHQHQKHQQLASSVSSSSSSSAPISTSSAPTLLWSKKGGITTAEVSPQPSIVTLHNHQEDTSPNDSSTLSFKAPREVKRIDFKEKVYVAPLTTVGNLPFRRVMKTLGADITIGEMAMAENIIAGQPSEWALLRRHASEDVFGVQLAGCHIDTMSRAAELIAATCSVDFVDINCGCPLDLVCNRGMGASMMGKHGRLRDLVVTMSRILPCPVTVKMRTGIEKDKDLRFAHKLIGKMRIWSACGDNFSDFVKRSPKALPLPRFHNDHGVDKEEEAGVTDVSDSSSSFLSYPVAAVTVHGRTRQQRYSQTADWSYISSCVDAANSQTVLCPPLVQLSTDGYDLTNPRVVKAWGLRDGEIEVAKAEEERVGLTNTSGITTSTNIGKLLIRPQRIPVIGNGDVMSYAEWREHIDATGVQTCLLARGVLIKPWLCTEIQEKRLNWDISSSERLDILRKFANYGLEHWGSDQNGVNHTRRFLLEWLAFLYRYVPVGLLERGEQRIGEKCPPRVVARDDLEQLMLSPDASDWVKISEMLLGPVPKDYRFVPKHKSSQAYEGDDKGDGEKTLGHGAGDKRGREDDDDDEEGGGGDDAEG